MNRRGFLSSILASGTAPYVARLSGVLMPVKAIAVPQYEWKTLSSSIVVPNSKGLSAEEITAIMTASINYHVGRNVAVVRPSAFRRFK